MEFGWLIKVHEEPPEHVSEGIKSMLKSKMISLALVLVCSKPGFTLVPTEPRKIVTYHTALHLSRSVYGHTAAIKAK